jgi:hypothetical protein
MSKLADTYVEISADSSKYDNAMARVRTQTQSTWAKLQAQTSDSTSRLMGIAAKATAVFGAAKLGVEGVSVAIAAWRGDVIATQKAIDRLYESASSVPVVGGLGQAIERLIWGKTLPEFKSDAAAKTQAYQEAQERVYDIRKESERRLQMVGKTGEERKALQIKFDLEDRIEELEKLKARMKAAGTFTPADQRAINESIENFRRALADQLSQIDDVASNGPQGLATMWDSAHEAAVKAAPRLQAWEEAMAYKAEAAKRKAAMARLEGRGGPHGGETLRDMLGTQIQRQKDILKQLEASPEPTDFSLRQSRQAAINAHQTKLENLQRQFESAKPEELSPNVWDRMATDFGNALRESLGMSTDRGRPLKVQMQEGERLIEVIDKLSGVLPSLGALR